MQFDEAAMEEGSKKLIDENPHLPIHMTDDEDDFLPPPSFLSQRQQLMDGVTTFASQL